MPQGLSIGRRISSEEKVRPANWALGRGRPRPSMLGSAMRSPALRQRRIHRSLKLQGQIRLREFGHLSLQSRLHLVGERLEALLSQGFMVR